MFFLNFVKIDLQKIDTKSLFIKTINSKNNLTQDTVRCFRFIKTHIFL